MSSLDPGLIEPSPESGPELPQVIGRYRLVHQVGGGSFAQVYLARELETGLGVALKVLRRDIDPALARQVKTRFFAEARIAQAIGHPAIVKIIESSPPGQTPCFIAMEYVEGLPFGEYFRTFDRQTQSNDRMLGAPERLFELARLGHQIAAAMSVAHGKGIVHRDLKPDNVLVTRAGQPPEVRILDFGIAKAPLDLFSPAGARRITRYHTELGTVMGSPPYMAPEQNGAAHQVTGKADVFALGVMLLVTALGLDPEALERGEPRLCFPDDLEHALALGPPLPETWRSLLCEMLALEPEQRPDMVRVARRLQRLAQKEAEFAGAVERWLEHGKIPSARELIRFLELGQRLPQLTEDERSFLGRAAAIRLRRLEIAAICCAALLFLAGSLGALGLVSRWREQHSVAAGQLREYVPPDRIQEVIQGRPAAGPGRGSAARETLSAQGSFPGTGGDSASSSPGPAPPPCQSMARWVELARERLSACNRARELEQAETKSLAARLARAEARLEAEQQDASRASEVAGSCQRDLKARIAELEEKTERLRLCTKSLRAAEAPEDQASERRAGQRNAQD